GTIELQTRFTDLAGHRGSHARFDDFPHQIARALIGHKAGGRTFHTRGTDAGNPFSYVAHPSATGDVIVQPRVTIHEYVDARAKLVGDRHWERTKMCFT